MENSPADSIMKIKDKNEIQNDTWDLEERETKKNSSGVLNVLVAGLALFSDGYNAQISMSSAKPTGSQMLIPPQSATWSLFYPACSYHNMPPNGD
jgi:hypothetical protein